MNDCTDDILCKRFKQTLYFAFVFDSDYFVMLVFI